MENINNINSDNIENIECEGYQKEKLTINLIWANVFGGLMLIPCILIFGLPYYFTWINGSIRSYIYSNYLIQHFVNSIVFQINAMFEKVDYIEYLIYAGISLLGILVSFLILILGIVLHELIHGIFSAKYAKNGFSSIKFGVFWEMLTPYCHCKEPLTIRHYIIAAIMPTIILGIIPSIIAILIGNILLLFFGMIFTTSGCGDILIIHSLRNTSKTDIVIDHPSAAGCYLFRKQQDN